MERAVQIMRNQPEVSLCRDCYTANETVVERLTASGYEVETLDRYTAFPSCPKEPKAENFNDPERYGEARTRYEQQWADYMEQEGGNHPQERSGEITVYAKIGQKEITFCYVENVTETETTDGTPAPAPLSPWRNWRSRTSAIRKSHSNARWRTPRNRFSKPTSRAASSVPMKTRCCTSSFCPRSGRNTSQPWGLRKTSRISRTRTRWGLSETSR